MTKRSRFRRTPGDLRVTWLAAASSIAVMAALAPGCALAEQPLSSIDPSGVVSSPQAAPPTPAVNPTPAGEAPASLDAMPRFVLAKVVFAHAKAVSEAELQAAYAGDVGKTVSLADLRAIARRAEGIYASHGYGFVVVVVTPQRVQDGVVRFDVIEGKIAGLSVLGADPDARRQATAAFQPLLNTSPPAAAGLEAAFERAKAVPGLVVTGALRRGDGEGDLDLVLQARKETWRIYANLNDLYPDAVGPFGLLFGLDHFGGSKYGDQASAQVYQSVESGSQTIARLSYDRGLDASGTRLSLAVFGAWASPKGSSQDLDFATNVAAGRIAISQPLIQRFAGDVAVTGALDISNQTTRVFGDTSLTQDNLRIFSVTLDGEWRPVPGDRLAGSLQLRQGVDFLGASHSGEASLSRPGADPEATVGNVSVEGEATITKGVRLVVRADGQFASGPLTEPEQYAVGNLSIGRGYQPGANYGDDALGSATEIRFGPYDGIPKAKIEPFVFFDAVRVWTLTPGDHTSRTLDSTGAGIRLELPNRLRVELTFAQPLRALLGLGEPTPHGRVLLNVTVGLTDIFMAIHQRLFHETGQ